jgi:hypothetical protein
MKKIEATELTTCQEREVQILYEQDGSKFGERGDCAFWRKRDGAFTVAMRPNEPGGAWSVHQTVLEGAYPCVGSNDFISSLTMRKRNGVWYRRSTRDGKSGVENTGFLYHRTDQ